MTIKTAICRDSLGNIVPVQCKVWTNGQVTCLKNTRNQLAKDHPDMTFEAWVTDLADHNLLNFFFLSPNVMARRVWAFYGGCIQQVKVNRDMTIETI